MSEKPSTLFLDILPDASRGILQILPVRKTFFLFAASKLYLALRPYFLENNLLNPKTTCSVVVMLYYGCKFMRKEGRENETNAAHCALVL